MRFTTLPAIAVAVIILATSTGFLPAQAADVDEQKAVLVTGASTGIGRKIAEVLAASGYFVYAGARKAEDLKSLNTIDNVQSVRLDVTVQDEIDAAVEFVSREGRGLHGVVNNAGVAVFGPLLTSPEDDLDWVFNVNVYGPYRINKAFAPLIIENGGRITTIGSVSGIESGALLGMYSMSKFAVEAYTDALAEELQPAGIHVSVVEPGGFKSKMADTTVERLMRHHEDGTAILSEELIQIAQSFVAANPQQKDPAEVAEAVVHALFSDNPKRRYLVTPDEGEAHGAIRSALRKVVELNQEHPYSLERDELVAILDDLLTVEE